MCIHWIQYILGGGGGGVTIGWKKTQRKKAEGEINFFLFKVNEKKQGKNANKHQRTYFCKLIYVSFNNCLRSNWSYFIKVYSYQGQNRLKRVPKVTRDPPVWHRHRGILCPLIGSFFNTKLQEEWHRNHFQLLELKMKLSNTNFVYCICLESPVKMIFICIYIISRLTEYLSTVPVQMWL